MEDWTDKYRPKSLYEVVGNANAIKELRNWADSWKKGVPKKKSGTIHSSQIPSYGGPKKLYLRFCL